MNATTLRRVGAPPQRGDAPGAPPLDAGLVQAVRARLAEAGTPPTPEHVAAALRAEGGPPEHMPVRAMVALLRAELIGAGPLQPLMADPAVTDVLVNGPNAVWIDRGRGLERIDLRFADEHALRRLAQRLAACAGRRLDDASPCVDACLPDGSRLHAVLPPLSADGTCVSLRLGRRAPFTLRELIAFGTLLPDMAALLADVVAARMPFLVSGGTGTGKTTLLSSMLSLVDPAERLVLIEETSELSPAHPHVVRLHTRPANQDGVGRVTLADLVREALRMRPDRIVVGEVRGAEVTELLAALNTGHEGCCGTVHANGAADVPPRLEALAAAAGLGRRALHSQLASALRVVVHLARGHDKLRRVTEVRVLRRDVDGFVHAVPALTAVGTETDRGAGWEFLRSRIDGRRE